MTYADRLASIGAEADTALAQADLDGWKAKATPIPDDICDRVGIPRGTRAIGPVLPAPVPREPAYI